MIPENAGSITADWLTDALTGSGVLKGERIEAIDIQSMAVGEGYVSEMVRISLNYAGDASGRPDTIIVKMPTAYAPALAIAQMYNLYEREIRFYNEVAGQSPIRTPKVLYSDMDSGLQKYILIMEDCANYAQVDQLEGMGYEQARLVALSLADFHAHWWDADNLKSFDWMPKPQGESAMSLIGTYRGCWDVASQMDDFLGALPEGGREAGQKIHENFDWIIEGVPDKNLTISHFDFRADNIFFDDENKENPIILIDWGGANVTGGVVDLSYLLGGSITTELRREIEKDVFKIYYDRLIEKGVSNYSYDECWIDYLKGHLCFAFIPVLSYASLDISSERGKEIAPLLTRRHFSAIVDNDATSVFP